MSARAKTKTVEFAGEQVEIRELSLRKYAEVGKIIGAMAGRAEIFDAFKSGDTEKQAGAMAKLLQVIPQDMARVIKLATDLEEEKVLDATTSEVLDLMVEIWQMNNLVDMFGKKLGGLLGSRPASPKLADDLKKPLKIREST